MTRFVSLEDIRLIAQRDANQSGKAIAILDLNKSFGHLYVMRYAEGIDPDCRDFVEIVQPDLKSFAVQRETEKL